MEQENKNKTAAQADTAPAQPEDTAAETAAEQTEDDVFAKIEKLAKLQEMGAITQEEFEAKKTELLAKI